MSDPTEKRPEILGALALIAGGENTDEVQDLFSGAQAEAVAESAMLPIDGTNGSEEKLQKWGFVLGEPIDGTFRRATLPPGWKMKRSDHPMWTFILDDRGRQRGQMFVKSMFVMTEAHVQWSGRFAVRGPITADGRDYHDLEDGESAQMHYIAEKKGVGEVFRTDSRLVTVSMESYSIREAMREEVQRWLNGNYPDWRYDDFAYWDD